MSAQRMSALLALFEADSMGLRDTVFHHLKIGDPFKVSENGDIYIKSYNPGAIQNATNIATGALVLMRGTDTVKVTR